MKGEIVATLDVKNGALVCRVLGVIESQAAHSLEAMYARQRREQTHNFFGEPTGPEGFAHVKPGRYNNMRSDRHGGGSWSYVFDDEFTDPGFWAWKARANQRDDHVDAATWGATKAAVSREQEAALRDYAARQQANQKTHGTYDFNAAFEDLKKRRRK